MEKIIQINIEKAIKLLDACGCRYAVIDPVGNLYGELEVVVPKKRSPNKHPRGELRSYIRPFVENLTPGEVASIPVLHYGFATVQSSVSSMVCAIFGNECCTTSRNVDANTIEVLRVV